MSTHEKLLFALEDPAPAARENFIAWAREVAQGSGVGRAEIEELDPDAQSAHTAKRVRFFAFASLWVSPDRVDQLRSGAPARAQWFQVRERLAFDRSARDDEARPWAGIKKTTPWAPVSGVDAAIWQARYTNHGEVAKAHHATCVRYRQNVVIAASVADVGAVSELWWTNTEDLVDRFYRSGEAEQLIAVDASGFVDATRAHPTVTTHETIRIGAVTGTRGFLPDATS